MRRIQIIKCFSTKIKSKTCYYKTLNLNSNATLDEIKKEYYRLAKIYHPDNVNENSSLNQTVLNSSFTFRINSKK